MKKTNKKPRAINSLVASGISTKWIYYGIITSLVAILFGSLNHLSATFLSIEPSDSSGIVPWVISVGIEAGMIAIALGIAERRRRKERPGMLYLFLMFFAFINLFSNIYFAFSTYTNIRNLKMEDVAKVDQLVIVTILILSGSLPVLILTLSELQSLFFIKLKQEEYTQKTIEDKERKKQEKLTERMERKRIKDERESKKVPFNSRIAITEPGITHQLAEGTVVSVNEEPIDNMKTDVKFDSMKYIRSESPATEEPKPVVRKPRGRPPLSTKSETEKYEDLNYVKEESITTPATPVRKAPQFVSSPLSDPFGDTSQVQIPLK